MSDEFEGVHEHIKNYGQKQKETMSYLSNGICEEFIAQGVNVKNRGRTENASKKTNIYLVPLIMKGKK